MRELPSTHVREGGGRRHMCKLGPKADAVPGLPQGPGRWKARESSPERARVIAADSQAPCGDGLPAGVCNHAAEDPWGL